MRSDLAVLRSGGQPGVVLRETSESGRQGLVIFSLSLKSARTVDCCLPERRQSSPLVFIWFRFRKDNQPTGFERGREGRRDRLTLKMSSFGLGVSDKGANNNRRKDEKKGTEEVTETSKTA